MKLKDSIIIILAVIVAISVGIFVGAKITEDKYKSKAKNNNEVIGDNHENISDNENKQDKNNNNSSNNEEKININVSSFIDKTVYLGSCMCDIVRTNKLTISLPQINSDSSVAKSLNEKIKNDYKDELKDANNPSGYEPSAFTDGLRTISYEYQITDDVIYIVVEQTGGSCATGYTSYKGYIYDTENDKILSTEDVLKNINISEQEFMNKVYEVYVGDASAEGKEQFLTTITINQFALIVHENKIVVYLLESGAGIASYGKREIKF